MANKATIRFHMFPTSILPPIKIKVQNTSAWELCELFHNVYQYTLSGDALSVRLIRLEYRLSLKRE